VPLSSDRINGARRQASETFHGTKREAQRELARLVAQADAGGRATGRVTFAQLLDRWWEQKRERLSPTTAREYRRVIERRLKPAAQSMLPAVPSACEAGDRAVRRAAPHPCAGRPWRDGRHSSD
jgi:hypothetical protein